LGVTQFGANSALLKLSPDKIFVSENFGPGKFYMDEINNRNFDYLATGELHAAFAQLDNQLGEKWRAVWGVRMEKFNQTLTGANNSNRPVTVNTAVTDFLPSANITFKATNKINVRLAASQTLIRPEFRELAPFEFFDFELVAGIKGNEKLKRTKITNLDLRYEIYPRAGELITAGIFYKYFQNPIEPFLNQTGPITFNIGYENAPKANAYGIELDIRKKLDVIGLKNFTATANLAYIYNKVEFGSGSALEKRPMQGQSPYVLNMGFEYAAGSNTAITALFNQVGRRIYFVGVNEFPSVWEAPRPVFDVQLNQKLMKGRSELRFSVTDIFNARAVFYQDQDSNGKFNGDKDFEFRKFNSGTNINVAFSYKLK
jgi:outer membrane receptor protein involved in Fe transport